ncbi:adenylyltransferase/cytidyltransferase family protein [Candidatus Uhrbacteria bacterium]|nr:adenylyltransferase/cytidyltransferase family protein [Candidatus Uhrbacteria bacterium]
MEKRVLVFGTFDGIHTGHEFFLRSAKARGTKLIVGVARDAYVASFKGRKPTFPEQKRLEKIQALSTVDHAQLCDPEISTFTIVEEIAPDLIVLGHDQHELEQALIAWMGNTGHYVPMMRAKKV